MPSALVRNAYYLNSQPTITMPSSRCPANVINPSNRLLSLVTEMMPVTSEASIMGIPTRTKLNPATSPKPVSSDLKSLALGRYVNMVVSMRREMPDPKRMSETLPMVSMFSFFSMQEDIGLNPAIIPDGIRQRNG